MMLVSLAETKQWLRIDYSDDDTRYTAMIQSATRTIMGFLKEEGYADFADSTGTLILDSDDVAIGVPSDVKAATMILVGYLDRGPDGDPDKAFTQGYLPPAVTAHIWHRRDPALA